MPVPVLERRSGGPVSGSAMPALFTTASAAKGRTFAMHARTAVSRAVAANEKEIRAFPEVGDRHLPAAR